MTVGASIEALETSIAHIRSAAVLCASLQTNAGVVAAFRLARAVNVMQAAVEKLRPISQNEEYAKRVTNALQLSIDKRTQER